MTVSCVRCGRSSTCARDQLCTLCRSALEEIAATRQTTREQVLREIEAYLFCGPDTGVTAATVRAAIHLARISK